mmetsp:Transcript_38510/g.121354  ORF Transcript_38510/g.121354 Transcript_38510/m.121354 type:complete len:131 (-) Transcript_38510:760-1152(-)
MEQTCVSQRHNCPLPSCSAINTTIYSSLSSSSFSSSSSSSSSSSNFLFLSVHLSVRFSSKAQTSISVTISVSALEILQTSLRQTSTRRGEGSHSMPPGLHPDPPARSLLLLLLVRVRATSSDSIDSLGAA